MKYLVLGLCCVFLSLQIGILAQDVSSVISKSQFNQMLKHRNDCSGARGFYTYEAFINAAKSFQGFGTTGDMNTRKREIAAFLAQTSHITSGGWKQSPDGPYAWGYCIKQEAVGNHPPSYCVSTQQWPCAPGKDYYGRGPIQIRGNENYGAIGKAIGVNLLANPELVTKDPVISFKTAIWFWMTPQSPQPSSHDVMTGRWIQSSHDVAANRVPGFGVVTNIFNGGFECGNGSNDQMQDRIGFFRRYTKILGVSPGNNLDCAKQRPFDS